MMFKRLREGALSPIRSSERAAGFDLFSVEDVILEPGKRSLVPTGIAVLPPFGHYCRVAPRSGLAVKDGIDVMAGVIDEDYTGEVMVCLINLGDKRRMLKAGSRIAQIIVEAIYTGPVFEVDKLPETNRSDQGFGSTGV